MIKKIKALIALYVFKKKWRQINKHNTTSVNRRFNLNNVSVGVNTYGILNIYTWGADNEGLQIGSYVSIASGVKFILGGNHRYNTISTFPFRAKLFNEENETYSNGKIIIEDDVWIGMDSIIMSGVKISRGAIIAAGSVVTKDVDEFSIVGGNPAKHIKYRFNKDIRENLAYLNLEDIPQNYIKKNLNLLYKDAEVTNINKIIGDINEFKK